MKKLVSLALILGLASIALAGDTKDAAKPNMAAMMAEMNKCAVCKNMASKMDAIGPMSMEVVNLNNGMAISHSVKDMSKLPIYHAASDACAKAGQACATMTDAQVKTDLCSFCQEIHGVMKSGGNMSMGKTKTGDLMVITSNDPAVQKRITGMAEKCAMMAGMMQASN